MEAEQYQSVVADKAEQTIGAPSEEMMIDDGDLRTTKELEVYYPSNDATTNNGAPSIIGQEKSTPAINTRVSKLQKLLSAVNFLGSYPTAKQSASRSYPLQFLADFAGGGPIQ